jgi:methyl-accepting chemotaxis protein
MPMIRDERGAIAPAYTAVITLVTVLLAAVLVNRVAWTAESINKKAKTIQDAAIGIKGDSTAVLNIDATNASASSILVSAEPLDQKLKQIVSLAQAVDVKAKSINGSASTVSGTAKDINNTASGIAPTAGGINSSVAGILDTAQSILRGVRQINQNLDGTIAVVTQIRGDTGNIRTAADLADTRAACIDRKTPVVGGVLGTIGLGQGSVEPDCRNTR